jgi:hypothetical protein
VQQKMNDQPPDFGTLTETTRSSFSSPDADPYRLSTWPVGVPSWLGAVIRVAPGSAVKRTIAAVGSLPGGIVSQSHNPRMLKAHGTAKARWLQRSHLMFISAGVRNYVSGLIDCY